MQEHRPRRATPDDVEAIAAVWHEAWRDGHLGHVPDHLAAQRTPDEFRSRVPSRIAGSSVVDDADGVVGFVTVRDDELEELFVAGRGRGTGAAVALLDLGERQIAEQFEIAWLAVVAGNARARRFYERQGWHDAGPIEYVAETARGPAIVPSHRYEKRVGQAASGP